MRKHGPCGHEAQYWTFISANVHWISLIGGVIALHASKGRSSVVWNTLDILRRDTDRSDDFNLDHIGGRWY